MKIVTELSVTIKDGEITYKEENPHYGAFVIDPDDAAFQIFVQNALDKFPGDKSGDIDIIVRTKTTLR